MAPIPSSKWLQEIKIEKPLITISHSVDAIIFMADLSFISSGERSRAIIALLYLNYENLHLNLGIFLVIFVQFGPVLVTIAIETKIKICENEHVF